MTIRWTVAPTSLGPLLIAATDKGLCRVAFDEDGMALARRFPAAEIVAGGAALAAQGLPLQRQPDIILRDRGLHRLRLVEWPLLRRPLALAMALSMILSLGDLGAIAMVLDQRSEGFLRLERVTQRQYRQSFSQRRRHVFGLQPWVLPKDLFRRDAVSVAFAPSTTASL